MVYDLCHPYALHDWLTSIGNHDHIFRLACVLCIVIVDTMLHRRWCHESQCCVLLCDGIRRQPMGLCSGLRFIMSVVVGGGGYVITWWALCWHVVHGQPLLASVYVGEVYTDCGG